MLTALALSAVLSGVPLAAADQVNASVNRRMVYVSDQAQYGRPDVWVTSPRSWQGDCEDYALTKRAALLQLGYASSALRIVTGYDWRGQRHAVLFIQDPAGVWYVLDNQDGRVRSAEAARRGGYTFDTAGPWAAPD